GDLIVERGVALRDRLQPVVEVEHHLVQRQLVDHKRAAADIGQLDLAAATVLAQLDHAAEVFVGGQDGGLDPRLADGLDLHDVRQVGRVVQVDLGPVAQADRVDDRRRRRDQIEVELAAQALLNDLQVQQAQEAATEAEAQGGRARHLIGEAGVVQAQLADGGAQVLEVGGVDRKQAAENHRLDFLKALQGFGGRLLLVGDGVADGGVGDFLDLGGDEADLAGAKLLDGRVLGQEDADAIDQMGRAGLHHLDAHPRLQHAVEHAYQQHHAQVGVVPGVDQHGLQRSVDVALGRGQTRDDGLQHVLDADAGLGRAHDGVGGVDADDVLDLRPHPVRLGGGQVDLVQDRNDLVVVVYGLINVGQRLGLDPLRGVHHQDRAFTGRQRARHLIGEVDVARRIHQVQDVVLPVLGLVVQAHGLRLDGDAALFLDVHVVEHLLGHFARGQAARELDQAVGQGRLVVVDVGDHREIADAFDRGRRHGPARVARRAALRHDADAQGAEDQTSGPQALELPLGRRQ